MFQHQRLYVHWAKCTFVLTKCGTFQDIRIFPFNLSRFWFRWFFKVWGLFGGRFIFKVFSFRMVFCAVTCWSVFFCGYAFLSGDERIMRHGHVLGVYTLNIIPLKLSIKCWGFLCDYLWRIRKVWLTDRWRAWHWPLFCTRQSLFRVFLFIFMGLILVQN